MLSGICCSTEGYDLQMGLAGLPAQVDRFVLDFTRPDVVDLHHALGREVLGVVAPETFTSAGLSHRQIEHYTPLFERVRDRWPGLWGYEICNESDLPSMGDLRPALWSMMLWRADAVLHGVSHGPAVLVTGGLGSGQPSYLQNVPLPPCMVLGLHAYDKSIDGWPTPDWGFGPLQGFLDAFRPYWSQMRGVALTELGITQDEPALASAYIHRCWDFLRRHPDVLLASWFSLSDTQHSGTPHGLVRADGSHKPQFDTYAKEITIMPSDPYRVSAEMRQHMRDSGDAPLGDEFFRIDTVIDGRVLKVSECPGSKGLYTYNSQANLTYASPLPK